MHQKGKNTQRNKIKLYKIKHFPSQDTTITNRTSSDVLIRVQVNCQLNRIIYIFAPKIK